MQPLFGRKRVVLASQSPRRQTLLRQLGLAFEVAPSEFDEESVTGLAPVDLVTTLSHRKAALVARAFDDAVVIGADTIVVLGETVLGKPRTPDEAERMLMMLSGREHMVYTGFTIVDRPSDRSVSEYEATRVHFRALGAEEVRAYVRAGSPMDKAGAYGIQDDYGAVFVERIDGCFYNVVGFPLAKFYVTMQAFSKELTRTKG
jgi:septum formation protein